MNTIENHPSAAYLTNAVSNFGVAYAATQESLRNNNASINAMQGQNQMLCNALGNHPLQACHNAHNKPTRDIENEASNMVNNRTKANTQRQQWWHQQRQRAKWTLHRQRLW
jgi:hypothetical protein